jgi:hypothetical protein
MLKLLVTDKPRKNIKSKVIDWKKDARVFHSESKSLRALRAKMSLNDEIRKIKDVQNVKDRQRKINKLK